MKLLLNIMIKIIIIAISFFIFNFNLFSQDFDNSVIFPEFPKYLNKLDSIRNHANLDIIQTDNTDDYDLEFSFSRNSELVRTKNLLFNSGINIHGLPQSKSEFFFEDVRLTSNFYGSFDLSHLAYILADEIIIDKIQNSKISGAHSLTSSIYSKILTPKSNDLKLHFHGGNYYGSGILKYAGVFQNFYWKTTATYKNTSGYNISDNIPIGYDFDIFELKNSDQEKASILIKTGIKDENSDISLSYMHLNTEKGIPFNHNNQFEKFYLRETEWKSDLFNFKYDTELNTNMSTNGNFYYYKFKNILDKFDDEEYNTQSLQDSYRKINDDYKFGANFSLNIENSILGPAEIFVNYERTLYKLQRNYGFEIKRTETELISFGINKLIIESENLKIDLFGKYHLYNVLFSDLSEVFSENSLYDCGISSVYLTNDELILNFKMNYSSKIPELALMLDSSKNFQNNEKSINSIFGAKWLPSNFFNLELNFYYSILNEIIFYRDLILNPNESFSYDDEIFGSNLKIGLNVKNYKLDFQYNYHNSQKNVYYYTPKNSILSKISAEYKFGFKWVLEYLLSSRREFGFQIQESPQFSILNFRLSQLIANKYEAYLRFDNILDEYFELVGGIPEPGFVFAAGIKINFGL